MNGVRRILFARLDRLFITWGQRLGNWSVWCLVKASVFRNLASKPKR